MGKSDLRVFIGADASNFNKNIKAAQGQLIKFENVAKSVGSSIKTALVGAFAIDSAQRFFSTIIEAGRGFEDQMARVKAISNASTKNFEMMRKEAARLGETTKYSASQAAAALENLVRNGLSATKATKALSSVLELAGANAIELAEAADIVTNTMNMFEISVDDLNRVNDVLSSTTAKSATNLTDLYEALKYSAPTANLFGIQIEEVNAALGVLANQGIKGSQAGTTLRNVLNSLVKPSKQAADILANLGIDEVSIKMDGLLGTLEKLKGLNIEDFVRIFGKEFGGITKALVDRGDLTAALKIELDGSQGEASRMFEEGAGNFNKAVDNFKSAFEGVMIKVFDSIQPALTGAINAGTEFISVISDLPTVLTAVGSALVGFGSKSIAQFISDVQKGRADLERTREGYREAIEGFGQLDLGIRLDDLFVPAKNLSQQASELKNLQRQAREAGLSFDFLNDAIKAADNSSLQGIYNQLEKLQDLAEGVGVPFRAFSSLMYDSSEDLAHTIKQIDRELKDLQDTSDNPNTKKYFKDLRQELKGFKKEMLDTGAVTKYRAALADLEEGLSNLPQRTSLARASINRLSEVFRRGASSIVAFFGGWATIGITAAIAGITALVGAWRQAGAAVREANEAMKEAHKQADKLQTSFKNTVNELANLKKGSIAWETRLKWLKQNYPELTEELRLNEVYVNSSSEAYKNLASAMDRVIARQSKIDLAEAATAARDRLNQAYANNDVTWLFDTNLKNIQDGLENAYKSEADKIAINAYIQELMSILASTVEDEVKKSQLKEVFNRMAKEFPKAKFSDQAHIGLLNDYNKEVGNEIKGLNKYLNGKTHQAPSTDEVSRYVYDALARLNEGIINAQKDAELKFSNPEEQASYVEEETRRFASQLLDEILNKFKGVKFEGKDVRDILKMDANFNEIANAARRKAVSEEDGGNGGSNVPNKTERELANEAILEAEDEYAKVTQMLADLCEKNLIETEEFDQRYLSALGSLISVYERWWHILDDDQAKAHEEWVRYYKELKQANPANNDSLAEYNKQVASDKSDYKSALAEILGRKSGIDIFSDNLTFEGDRLGHIKGQLEDLKALREEYLGKGFDDEVKKLDGAIITLTQHVEELDKAFTAERLKEFKKELSDLTWNVGTASYDTFVGLGQAFINVRNAMDTLSNLDEYKTEWERFVAGFQAFLQITDTLVNTAVGIKDLAEMFKELRKQKELFNAIDSGSKVADIAGIEMEAAAVVQAEATKTAAKETAAAADIATKMLQAEAAQILMAAESTAAYAAIPFAGPALAAAQIAEMKALILAAASLPAFANGGIVGGNSYIGDKVLARVNSGEMILNQKQQKNLFSMLNNGSVNGGGQVKFKIEGKELVGVLKNYNNIKGKVQ